MDGASAESLEETPAPAPLPPYVYIDTEEVWLECLLALRKEQRIAVDLEANSLYVYREQISLIQLSTETQDYILDPLAGLDLSPFVKLLADCNIEKVFHASEYDLVLLKRDFDCEVCNLFDTMWAARILGYTNMGLAGFLRDFYGVTLSKKYQKANWAARPLTVPQLEYAQKDTHYLLRLRDLFGARLEEEGYTEEAREIFRNKCRVTLPDRTFNPDAFWTMRGARELDPAGRTLLRALYVYRDSEASRRNLPPFKILTNEMLVHIAQTAPETLQELKEKTKLPERIMDRMGTALVRVLEEARKGPAPTRPQRPQRRTSEEYERYDRLQQWRKETAQERGVESDVILTRDTMWELARRNPVTLAELEQITTLGPKRIAMYGPLILEQLR
jgi:ribonuclease D